jgi:hypothetical protein
MQHRSLRQHRSLAPRRGFAVAAIALTLVMVTPELTQSAGAVAHSGRAATHTQFVAKKHKKRRRPLTLAQKRVLLQRYLAAHPGVVLSRKTGKATYGAPAKKTAKTTKTTRKRVNAATLRYRRAIAAKLRAGKGAGTAKRAGLRSTRLRSKPITKRSAAPLSLPELALYAIAPFLLMGLYLFGTDYLRRRAQGQRRRGSLRKRRASLVITRASNR